MKIALERMEAGRVEDFKNNLIIIGLSIRNGGLSKNNFLIDSESREFKHSIPQCSIKIMQKNAKYSSDVRSLNINIYINLWVGMSKIIE